MAKTAPTLLWIVYMFLLGNIISIECFEKDYLNTEERAYHNKIEQLYDKARGANKHLFLRDLKRGREFIHPEDPNKVIRIHYYDQLKHQGYIMLEADRLETLNSNDAQLEGSPRISQKIFKVFCVIHEDIYTYAVELERFRGQMIESTKQDPALTTYLMDFGNRLELYQTLTVALQHYYNIGYKHCALDIKQILYKRRDDDFSKNDGLNNDSQYDFVMSNLGYMVPTDTPCSNGRKDSQDHNDKLGNIPSSDKCKRKIEVFGLGLIFLELEVLVNGVNENLEIANKQEVVIEGYSALPDAPRDLELFFKKKTPLSDYTLIEMFSKIRTMIAMWNSKVTIVEGLDVTYKSVNKDLEYVTKVNTFIFETHNNTLCPTLVKNNNAKQKIDGAYKMLNVLMLKMMEENDFVNGRPNQNEIGIKLVEILSDYKAGVAMINRRRQMLV